MAQHAGAVTALSVQQVLRPLQSAFFAATFFSLGINLLMLVSPLYLMQVFDRVLTTSSLHTLFWLSLIAIASLAVYGVFEVVRGRILSKIGIWLESEATSHLIKAGMQGARSTGGRAGALHDLAHVRGFLSGSAIHAVFDAPRGFVFLLVLWALHPWFGIFAVVSMGLMIALAIGGDFLTRRLSGQARDFQQAATAGAEVALRNADVIRAMGMTGAIIGRWSRWHGEASRQQNRLNDNAVTLSGLSKFIRMSVQTAIIGLGAMLVMKGEVTAGGIIAASILLGRALAPADQAIASWKQIASVRAAWRRVNDALRTAAPAQEPMQLPTPEGHLAVENISFQLHRAPEPLLKNISVALLPGESLAVVGPSAAGKTLFCRVVAGLVEPTAGHVRIDHADLGAWAEEDLRPHVGYLPQDVALFAGTVAENIARFSDADPEAIVDAAKLAGVHELILRLRDGYQTDVSEFGHLLSGGQRQRIGLARAVFGNPKLVILDEPNSNLDPAGEAAVLQAIQELKRRRCTLIIVSHKLSIVQNLDKTLLLEAGAVRTLGPSTQVLAMLMGEPAQPAISAPAAVRTTPTRTA